ncbi:hypothetical protein N7494_012457 [Penicillium frequentans]|uniref:Apple domain-containing protein n=1 Tax=Penicillium frequentans TaxID=3151616 RepID=A0AAD6CLK7_9EURO|nr:hypothetical protein N7494_012457 [Penicillium glabrum]
MGRLLLPALAALSPWITVFATEITSTFTTLVPTTAIVTYSSSIAGCTVASSMQIACSDGYYNVYGLMWQETCAASTSGGSLLLSSEGLSLRACAGGCAVRSSCTAVTWDSTNNMCYLWEGDVTVTPGGSYQAAIRSASTSASGPSPNTPATSSGSSLSAQSSEDLGGSTPSTSIYTVTTTQVQTVTSCAATVTDCPANQQKTYLTTETITYVTTFCPEADQTNAQSAAATGSTTLPPTVVFQSYNAQQGSTQIDSASWAQITDIGIPSSQSTTSTAYVTEIEVVTACPPFVHDCPVGQKSTYTTTKTVAAYTTTYLVAVTDSAQASHLTSPVVHPIAVPNLSLVHSHAPNPIPSSDNANYTLPHALSSSLWKADPASSGVTQAMHATTMNTVAGKSTSSVTTSAPGSLFTGDAPKMGQFSTLFTVVAVLSSLLLMY